MLAIAFAVFGVWALWVTRRPKLRWAFAAAFAGVVVWFASHPPVARPRRGGRRWPSCRARSSTATACASPASATSTSASRDDFTARYEEREFSLAHVTSVDLFISYWTPGPVGHTFVSFNFDDGTPPLCISIETRPEVGEGFAPIASMFKQFELIYVVGDEHDLVGVRTNHRDEEVYLYPLRTTPEARAAAAGVYLDRINELADHPEFYHLLKNSCTVNIVRYANVAGRQGRFDIRHLLNGWIDRYLYAAGWVDTSLPFAELRRPLADHRGRHGRGGRRRTSQHAFVRRCRARNRQVTSRPFTRVIALSCGDGSCATATPS